MPIYHGTCDNCRYETEQFLRANKDTITLDCKRCHRQVLVRQERDKAVEFKEKDNLIGQLRHEQ